MSKQEEIAALKQEIEKKERQLYRANKEMSAWNKGMARSHSNSKMSRLFMESQRKEIADLQMQLSKLEKGK
jgi:predicted  nucleic acid-binding Zn-ribbon protein